MTTYTLRPEYPNIQPPTSPKECVQIVTDLTLSKNSEDKYSLYLAKQYFMQNIFLFNKDDFSKMFENSLFMRKIGNKYGSEIISKYLQKQIPLPFLHESWLSLIMSDKPSEISKQYLNLLNQHNNEEQLRILSNHNKYLVTQDFFSQTKTPCEALINIVLEENPQRVLELPSWTPDEICNWLISNKELTQKIINQSTFTLRYQHIHAKVRQQIYKNTIDNFYSNSQDLAQRKFIYSSLISFPHEYLIFFKDNHSNLYNKLLEDNITNTENNHLTMNGAQYIITNRKFASLKEVKELFNDKKESILKKLTLKLDIFTTIVHPFEFGIRNNMLPIFTPFSLQDGLNEYEKEMLGAAAFMSLRDKYAKKPSAFATKELRQSNLNILMLNWYEPIIKECTLKQFDEYSAEILKMDSDDKLRTELDSLRLFVELNNNLPKNPTLGKKAKI